jgi:hypothetical protein
MHLLTTMIIMVIPRNLCKLYKLYEVWLFDHNEELRDLNSSPSIIRIIKSRRMGCSTNGGEEERV